MENLLNTYVMYPMQGSRLIPYSPHNYQQLLQPSEIQPLNVFDIHGSPLTIYDTGLGYCYLNPPTVPYTLANQATRPSCDHEFMRRCLISNGVAYSRGLVGDYRGDMCCLICLDDMGESGGDVEVARSQACSHCFHGGCIEKWYAASLPGGFPECPLCRFPIVEWGIPEPEPELTEPPF